MTRRLGYVHDLVDVVEGDAAASEIRMASSRQRTLRSEGIVLTHRYLFWMNEKLPVRGFYTMVLLNGSSGSNVLPGLCMTLVSARLEGHMIACWHNKCRIM